MTTQQPQQATSDSADFVADFTDPALIGSPEKGVEREVAGLLFLSFGLLGCLGVLAAIHWAAGLSAALLGLGAAGALLRRTATQRWKQDASMVMAFAGYAGQAAVLFYLYQPAGWLLVSATAAAVGLWLSSTESD
ncbi:hypothetical protein [Streptomyces similanensis]|uniref:hypothetical protein n=1 Tax=Streptomyces similanensis TaxID=1274988 RepID=UPI0031E8ECA0